MKRVSVRSSVLRSVGYDPLTSRLEVEFSRDGDVYEYQMVPPSKYRELMDAPSIGGYFDANIRHIYPYVRVG